MYIEMIIEQSILSNDQNVPKAFAIEGYGFPEINRSLLITLRELH